MITDYSSEIKIVIFYLFRNASVPNGDDRQKFRQSRSIIFTFTRASGSVILATGTL